MTSAPTLTHLSPVERDELDWLLTSGVLGRSTNVPRVLRYLCEETAAGHSDTLKEYSVAVEALGRRPDFDPQTDTIVRVTVHALRKRLQEIYADDKHSRPVRVVVPPGQYAAYFLPVRPAPALRVAEELSLPLLPAVQVQPAGAVSPPSSAAPSVLPEPPDAKRRFLLLPTLVAAVLGIGAVGAWKVHSRSSASPLPPAGPLASVHALFGQKRHAYTDHSGVVWTPSTFCQGGSPTSGSDPHVGGTEDPYLYSAGVRGMVHCVFPVEPGYYELRFHFAEPSDLEPATRTASISINAGVPSSVDVVDRAGGDHLATTVVYPGYRAESDGAIHVDFISEVSPLNALELVPTPTPGQLPTRIVSASASFTDSQNQIWLSDRYFVGGRRGLPPTRAGETSLGLFAADRIGTFRYMLPAVPSARYTVKLYFREPWFGQEFGVPGGPGSRVFNVSVNGVPLLTHFDILAEGHSAPVVKSFDHVQATSTGVVEFSFIPVQNYPVVNAIELIPES